MHDAKGRELTVGDTVMMPCTIVTLNGNPEYCNVSIETVASMFPSKTKTTLTANTKQLLRANVGDNIGFSTIVNEDGSIGIE